MAPVRRGAPAGGASPAREPVDRVGPGLAGVSADAARLRADHRALVAAAAVRIRAATGAARREPGRLDRARVAVDRWVTRHAGNLTSIARDLRGVAGLDEPGLPVR